MFTPHRAWVTISWAVLATCLPRDLTPTLTPIVISTKSASPTPTSPPTATTLSTTTTLPISTTPTPLEPFSITNKGDDVVSDSSDGDGDYDEVYDDNGKYEEDEYYDDDKEMREDEYDADSDSYEYDDYYEDEDDDYDDDDDDDDDYDEDDDDDFYEDDLNESDFNQYTDYTSHKDDKITYDGYVDTYWEKDVENYEYDYDEDDDVERRNINDGEYDKEEHFEVDGLMRKQDVETDGMVYMFLEGNSSNLLPYHLGPLIDGARGSGDNERDRESADSKDQGVTIGKFNSSDNTSHSNNDIYTKVYNEIEIDTAKVGRHNGNKRESNGGQGNKQGGVVSINEGGDSQEIIETVSKRSDLELPYLVVEEGYVPLPESVIFLSDEELQRLEEPTQLLKESPIEDASLSSHEHGKNTAQYHEYGNEKGEVNFKLNNGTTLWPTDTSVESSADGQDVTTLLPADNDPSSGYITSEEVEQLLEYYNDMMTNSSFEEEWEAGEDGNEEVREEYLGPDATPSEVPQSPDAILSPSITELNLKSVYESILNAKTVSVREKLEVGRLERLRRTVEGLGGLKVLQESHVAHHIVRRQLRGDEACGVFSRKRKRREVEERSGYHGGHSSLWDRVELEQSGHSEGVSSEAESTQGNGETVAGAEGAGKKRTVRRRRGVSNVGRRLEQGNAGFRQLFTQYKKMCDFIAMALFER